MALLVDLPDFAFLTPDAANYGQNAWVENLVNQSLTRLNARNLGLSAEEMAQLFSSADLQVRQIGGNGDEVSSEDFTSSAVLAYCMLFMIYMSLILYGNMVASGVAEEKSSRIMEVMIAKVAHGAHGREDLGDRGFEPHAVCYLGGCCIGYFRSAPGWLVWLFP